MITISRTTVVSVLAALTLAITVAANLSPAPPAEGSQVNTSAGLTSTGLPLALRGYDPVSYVQGAAPLAGQASFSATHEGATYRFANEENQEAFEDSPSRYVPRFGGYCAYGVSVGKKFDGDPLVYKLHDGRLYLNLNPDIAAKFGEDVPGNVGKAVDQWARIHDKSPADL